RRRPSEYPRADEGVRVRCPDQHKLGFDEPSTNGRRALDEPSSPDLGILGSRDLGISSSKPTKAAPSRFDEFWAVFPRRVGKQDAKNAFAKAIKLTTAQTIIDGASRYRYD